MLFTAYICLRCTGTWSWASGRPWAKTSWFQECSQCERLIILRSLLPRTPPSASYRLIPTLSLCTSYSALKKDGQRLSTLMKRGETVEARPARPVTVHSISLLKFQPPFFTLGKTWDSLLRLYTFVLCVGLFLHGWNGSLWSWNCFECQKSYGLISQEANVTSLLEVQRQQD